MRSSISNEAQNLASLAASLMLTVQHHSKIEMSSHMMCCDLSARESAVVFRFVELSKVALVPSNLV